MLDGLKGYVSLVSGLTEATAARAREVATALLAQGGVQGVPAGATAMAAQIAGLAEDLLVTARDNRGVLMEVVRAEAERAVASIGVITTAEAEGLRGRIADLERELATERAGAVLAAGPPKRTTPKKTTPKKTTARRVATSPVTTASPARTRTSTTRIPTTRAAATKKTAATKKSAATTKSAATKRATSPLTSTTPGASPGE